MRNCPALAVQAEAERERQERKRSVQGRFWPALALEREAAKKNHGDGLRQLQLDVSLAYDGLQWAEQLWRVRRAMVDNNTVVSDEVEALKRSGLVPRLKQTDAQPLSRRRQLSNAS